MVSGPVRIDRQVLEEENCHSHRGHSQLVDSRSRSEYRKSGRDIFPMLLPLRCCSACMSSGPSKLSPVIHRRFIPRQARYNVDMQVRLKVTDARRRRRAAARSENDPDEDVAQESDLSISEQDGDTSGSSSRGSTNASIPLSETNKVPLSPRAISQLNKSSLGRPRQKKTSGSPDSEDGHGTKPSRSEDSRSSPIKSKLYSWLKWPLTGSDSSQSNPVASSDDDPVPSSSAPRSKSSQKVFKELMQGALLSLDPARAQHLQTETQDTEADELNESDRAKELDLLESELHPSISLSLSVYHPRGQADHRSAR